MASKTDIIEALLFAADRPVAVEKLAEIAELTAEAVLAEIEALRAEKAQIGALQLVDVAGGFQFVTKPEFAPFIRKLRDEKRQKLSRAAFEVLAIVAYRQPVTRSEIEGLRGVECAGPLHFLLERKLIAPAGRREVPGRPWLYKSTPQFLDQFGLNSLEDLPELDEFAALEGTGHHPATLNLFERGTVANGLASPDAFEEVSPEDGVASSDAPEEPLPEDGGASSDALEEESRDVSEVEISDLGS